MVLSFFKRGSGEGNFDHIVSRSVSMLGDARHSFDLATLALLTETGAETVAADIRETDDRINHAEQELRSELVVHVSVQGPADIGTVLGFTLLLKKIERIGDQAKNILDLAEEGVSLTGQPDIDELNARRQEISEMFAQTAVLLGEGAPDEIETFYAAGAQLRHDLEGKVREYMHSEERGVYAVPRAILYRYWKRIVANLIGILTTATEPLQNQDYLDEGRTDIVDD